MPSLFCHLDAEGEGVIPVPMSTTEKPLTAIDYIACLEEARSKEDVELFTEQVPLGVYYDKRFIKAVQRRLAALQNTKAA